MSGDGFPTSYAPLEKLLGHRFKDKRYLEEGLTHKSYAMDRGGAIAFNERLEFLGDSIISAIVADHLFFRYPNDDEGKLSQIKSHLVSRQTLTEWAKEIELGQFIRMSRAEEATGGRERNSILGNTLESVVGALYLEAGYLTVHRFVSKRLKQRKRIVVSDYKSKLQEVIQKTYKSPPEYAVHQTIGPEHDKTFEVVVRIQKTQLGSGRGKSKKEAEQAAARAALKKLR